MRPPAKLKEQVGAIARMLKIDHVLGHAPRELSNGQKQRTALARALVAPAQGAAARRSAAQCRCQAALRDAPGAAAPAAHFQRRRHLCDAGLQGGDGARRPHRRAAQWPDRAMGGAGDVYREPISVGRGAAVRRSHHQPAALQAGDEWHRLGHSAGPARSSLRRLRPRGGSRPDCRVAAGACRGHRGRGAGCHPLRSRRRDAGQRAQRALSARPQGRGIAGDRRRDRGRQVRPRPSQGMGAVRARRSAAVRRRERPARRAAGSLRERSWHSFSSTTSPRPTARAARNRCRR